MVPDKDDSSTPVRGQVVPDSREFYETRRKFRTNAGKYAKAAGHGKEFRLLAEIVSRSTPKDPYSWAVVTGQQDWADALGLSLRTLERHLSKLRSAGLLEGSVRRSPAVRGKLGERYEFPVYTVPGWLVEEVSRWADSDFWPGTANRHFGGYTVSVNNAGDTVDNPQMPVTARVPASDVTDVTGAPIYKDIEEQEIPTDRVSRRLRRRATTRSGMRHWDDEGYDPPMIGGDPDRVPESDRNRTPTSRAAKAFEQCWDDMFAKYPAKKMVLPLHPWNHGQKRWFMAWLKKDFLPLVDGDVGRAEKVFAEFCSDLGSGREHVPGEMPAFKRLFQLADKYLRRVTSVVDDEQRLKVSGERERMASAARPRYDRRTRREDAPSRTESQFFLD